VVLVVEVTERNTLIITDLIIGSTSAEPIFGGIGLSQQNFLGRGFGLSGAFVWGDPDRFALRGAFFAPDVPVPGLRRGLVLGASFILLQGEEFVCSDPSCSTFSGDLGSAPRIRYRRLGGEGTIGVRPGPFERIFASYRYEALDATQEGFIGPAPGPVPAILAGRSTLSALAGTYEMDTRDDFFFPREGWRGLFQVTFGSRLLGSDYEYSRYLLQAESAYSILGHLRLQGAVGAAQGSAPFFDRFYAADWNYFTIGPALGRALEVNYSTDSRYDAFLLMGGGEYAIPLWSGSSFFRRGFLALGARLVYSTATLGGPRTTVSTTPFSADIALRFDTPVGMFNFSTAYLLNIIL
jgi:outer membrane protein assembly factor BamA